MSRPNLRLAAAALASLSFSSCGSHLDSPDSAIEHVLAELADNNPRALWDSLPRRYQEDVHGLIHSVAAKLDPEVYDQAFALGRRFLRVVDQKRDLVLAQLPMLFPRDKVEGLWDPALEACRIIVNSSISSVKGLRTMDVGTFLGGTGREAMAMLTNAFEQQGGETPASVLAAVQVELVRSTGESATVRVVSPKHGLANELHMTKIEGRWVPTEMAQGWAMAMGQARAALDRMPSMTEGKMKAMAKAELARFEQQLDALEKATTAQSFARALQAGSRKPPARPR